MNKRIRKLAEQAGLDMWINGNDEVELPENQKKFAELIVKECADISDASFHDGSAGYTAILKHFGVEE